MSFYPALLAVHVTCVTMSGLLFVLRGACMFAASPVLQWRWVKIGPHAVDTVLLVSAVSLAILRGEHANPGGWLLMKLVLLPVYIGLGLVALRFGSGMPIRAGAFLTALLVFFYIVSVAITKSARPWF